MMNKEYWFSGEPKVLQLLIKEIGVQEPGMTKEKQLASMFSSARSIWTLILPSPQHKKYLVHFYLCWNVGGHPIPSRASWKDHQEFLQGKRLSFINHHTIIATMEHLKQRNIRIFEGRFAHIDIIKKWIEVPLLNKEYMGLQFHASQEISMPMTM